MYSDFIQDCPECGSSNVYQAECDDLDCLDCGGLFNWCLDCDWGDHIDHNYQEAEKGLLE